MRSVPTLAIALPLFFCGCGGSVPPTHFYVLGPQDVSRVETLDTATTRGMTIGVETFRVDPPYDQDRIVYRINAGSPEVGFYAYHRWAAPLERMLPGVVASAYRGVPGTRSIEPVVSGRSYDALLRGRVLAFEEIDTPEGPQIRVRVTLRLDASDGTQLWTATLSRDTHVSSNDVGSVVEELRSALLAAIHESRPNLQSALHASH
jgi:ABC-type uncharacterized transport system auxiliary subunit